MLQISTGHGTGRRTVAQPLAAAPGGLAARTSALSTGCGAGACGAPGAPFARPAQGARKSRGEAECACAELARPHGARRQALFWRLLSDLSAATSWPLRVWRLRTRSGNRCLLGKYDCTADLSLYTNMVAAGSSKMTISSIVVRHGSHEIRK
jgi:hypothetical protein